MHLKGGGQQITRIDATVYYSPTIFKDSGIKSDQELLAATVATTNYGNVASKVIGLN
jgi:hypothetical protein